MYKEQKISTYTETNKRIQLLKLTEINSDGIETCYEKYQIRINRIIKSNYRSEGMARKAFATIITTEILQQKFSF